MSGGPSGFHNAPVTRAFVVGSAVLTLAFGIKGRPPRIGLGLSNQDIFKKLRISKVVSSVFAFSSTPELVFGLYLLYYFRVFERQIGSNKYSVFILFSTITSSLLEILALKYIEDPTLDVLASGPYGLIFASFVPFFFDIPISSRFRVFGVPFTDKSLTYLAGLQLLFSSWKRSLIPGVCGILAGSLYRLNVFGIRRAKLPEFIASFFSRLSVPSGGGSSRNLSGGGSSRVLPGAGGNIIRNPPYVGQQREINFVNPAHVQEPPQDSIATLVSMGFDSNSARQALVRARNDITMATNILLESQSH